MIEKVIILDVDKLSPTIKEGLENGIYKVFNGVVRDKSGNMIKYNYHSKSEFSKKYQHLLISV